jgi:hypothetical protein
MLLTLEKPEVWQYSSSTLSQFSLLNNMPDPLASDINNRASYSQFKTCSASYIQFNGATLQRG